VAVFLPDSVPWPGPATLLPTLATAAVIAGGSVRGPAGAGFLLSRPPLQRIGDLSYSLYLWHWPLLVLARAQWGDLGWVAGLVVVLISAGPAVLTHRFVESPLHHAPSLARLPARALVVGLVCTAIGVGAGFGLRLAIPSVDVIAASERPGAAALLTTPRTAIAHDTAASITPDPLRARDDLPELYARGCQSTYAEAVPKPCYFGDLSSSVTVALVGDSRAAQWAPAVQAVAAQRGWRVMTVTKAGCPFADVPLAKGPVGQQVAYPSCVAWNAALAGLLRAGPHRPTFVVTSAFSPYIAADPAGHGLTGAANQTALSAGFHRSWAALNQAGVPVVALRETPLMSTDVAECVAQHRSSLSECDRLRSGALRAATVISPAAQGLPATRMLDLTSGVCPVKHCPVVIGNVLIYRDNHHLTATYARSLAPFLSAGLAELRRTHFAGDRLRGILPTR
jgi:SGNH domain-containing protein